MDIGFKVVTPLPLEELWDSTGPLAASRRKALTKGELTRLLQAGLVQFVVAHTGSPLRWIPLENCCSFWKANALPHLAEPGAHAVLGRFPNGYCYFASEWELGGHDSTVVVLEKSH